MKTKLLFLTLALSAFGFQAFAQPVNDVFSGAIPITPAADGTGCSSPFNLPFSTDGTTDSGVQGSCRASGLDQFFTWTATTFGLNFSSENPGNPGIVVYSINNMELTEIACTDTFASETIGGWNIGDDLIIQIYDFEGTGASDVAFCLEVTNNVPVPAPVTFTASSSGSSGSYRYGCVDMNGDHLDDLVSISSTNVNIREQNPGGGFTTKNITTTSANYLPSWSLAAADYNKDGYTDLLYGAGNGVTFMRSDGTGNGFTEVSGPEDVFSQRSNFVDINNDGHLDAFVCHDVAPNVYYLNDGSGNLTFYQGAQYDNGCNNPATSIDQVGAVGGLGNYCSGGNYGSIWIDYDNDRDLDLFIAKCGGETARRTNQMLTNNGDGSFTENASDLGLADPMQTWSAAWGDFDNDGDMDVFVGASSGDHKLMRNDGGTFVDISAGSGVNSLSLTSTETVTFDFDNDGNLDLVSGGNLLFGDGNMNFTVHTGIFPGAGAYGDVNNDGYIDAFNSSNIYINNKETNNNWIKINTVGTTSNIDGIGARVEIYTDSGVQIRDVKSGDGFRYMNSLNTHFGIGSDTSVSHITIYWPNSGCETFLNPSINQPFTAVEGAGVSCDIVVSPIVYLEGAALNPNSGENNLMRDDLRLNGWLTSNATTSPYVDALIADPSVFNATGADAIVDWVFVELRDKDDNTIILDSKSALLQRDGDVVDIDGVSALSFEQERGNYYISIKHRNHIGLLSATTFALSPSNTVIDLSANPNSVEGASNAVASLANGKYGMYTGDYDGNAQIQNSDASDVIQLIGGSGYDNADMDVNTQIQNSDVNTLINPNIGRGQQFQRSAADQLDTNVTLSFANAQITNDGSDNFYEADILIASTENLYIGSGQVYFDYNTAAFGENVSSNNAIEYSQPAGSILGYTFGMFSPAYKDFVQNDNITSRVSLSFQQNIAQVGLETAPEIQITSTPKVLFHIKIKYVDAGEEAGVCFYNQGVFQDQFFTACGGPGTADCTNNPGEQIFDDTYDCSAAAVSTLNIAKYDTNAISVYPNPVKNTIYIKGNTENLTRIDIVNINGQLIKTIDSDFNQIDVSQLDAAIYFLKLYSEENITTKKMIKH